MDVPAESRRLLVGGIDVIAVDRVVAEVLSINNPENAPMLRAAKRLEIDEQDLSKIEIAGERLPSVKVHGFILPELTPIGFNFIRVVKNTIKHLWLKTVGKPRLQA